MTYEADAAGVLEIVAEEGDTLAIGEVIAKLKARGGGRGADELRGREAPPRTATDEQEPSRRSCRVRRGRGCRRGAAADEDEEPADEEPAGEPPPTGRRGRRRRADQGLPGRPPARPRARRRPRHAARHRPRRADREGRRRGRADERRRRGAAARARKPAPEAEPAGTVAERGTAKGDVVVQEPSRLQGVIARRMAESKATIPEFVIRPTSTWRAASSCAGSSRSASGPTPRVPSYNDMVVKACALALREFPRANGAYRDGRFELYGRVNVGVAVAGQDALVVPTVFDADRRSLGDIARETRDLAGKVRDGNDPAARAQRRHVHRLEPRHVRRDRLHRRHQPAAGGDPRRRSDGARCRSSSTVASSCATAWRSRSPATTGSSTAPTQRSSSRGSASCSRSRSRSCSSADQQGGGAGGRVGTAPSSRPAARPAGLRGGRARVGLRRRAARGRLPAASSWAARGSLRRLRLRGLLGRRLRRLRLRLGAGSGCRRALPGVGRRLRGDLRVGGRRRGGLRRRRRLLVGPADARRPTAVSGAVCVSPCSSVDGACGASAGADSVVGAVPWCGAKLRRACDSCVVDVCCCSLSAVSDCSVTGRAQRHAPLARLVARLRGLSVVAGAGVLAGAWTAGGRAPARCGRDRADRDGLLVLVVSCVRPGPWSRACAPSRRRSARPSCRRASSSGAGVLPTPTWTAGADADGAAGAPRTSGGSAEPELPFVVVFTVRSIGARATGPPFGGAERPGHPLTATSVLVKKSTHAAAATMDRVAPRVASKPLGVRTSSTSAGKRSS